MTSVTPVDLIRRPEPFDSDDYTFELKMDGFGKLGYVAEYQTRLVSRRGNVYKSFPDPCTIIHIDLDCEAVLDGRGLVITTTD